MSQPTPDESQRAFSNLVDHGTAVARENDVCNAIAAAALYLGERLDEQNRRLDEQNRLLTIIAEKVGEDAESAALRMLEERR